MRKFPKNFDDFLVQGLRSDHRNQLNVPGLRKCVNAKPKLQQGIKSLVAFEPLYNLPLITNIEFSFPFPQVFRGSEVTLLADETIIYHVDSRTGALTQLTTLDARVGGSRDIPPGKSWQFADMHDYWLLNNGKCTIFARAPILTSTTRPLVYLEDRIWIEAVATFNGQELLGGFDTEHFWDENWQNLFNMWKQNFPDDFDMNLKMGSNFVFWSTIGEAALPWLISVTEATTGTGMSGAYTAPQYRSATSTPGNRLHDMMKRNQWGFMPMPWQGKVRHIKKLAKSVIVYGDNGVSRMFPANSTYGVDDFTDIPGIASRNSVGGNESEHLFVDNTGVLWYISSQGLNRLGYEEFFIPMLGTDIVISFDQALHEWYICNNNSGFVFTGTGLGEISQIISSSVVLNGVRTGTHAETGNDSIEVITNPFDLGPPGRKKISQVTAGIFGESINLCGIYFRNMDGEGWRFKDYVRLNGYGTVMMNTTGQEFMLSLKSVPFHNSQIRSLDVEWELEDKRFVRSAYGNPAASAITS